MTHHTTTSKDRLAATLRDRGLNDDMINGILATTDEATAATMLANLEQADSDRTALRERLVANPTLRRAVCPCNEWKTADQRFDVAQTAVAILERRAAGQAYTVDDLAAQLVADHGTVQDQITQYGDDPRLDGFGTGSFYAFRCRVRDAHAALTRETNAKAEAVRRAAEDAAWAAQGLERCDRCGGAGGWKGWPGFTCYECGGNRAVPAKG